MNQAHFHLVVNHLPIIFPLVGILVLAIGIIFGSEIVKRTSFFVFILGAIATIFAMSSGEGAEEIAENIAGVTDQYIHEHEEKAEVFALLSYILGAFSLIGLWASWKKKGFSTIVSYLVLTLSLVVIFFGKQTGTTGGEIRHTEIRANQSAGNTSDTGETQESEDEDE